MSTLCKVELDKEITITLKLSAEEYELISPDIKEFMVLPANGFSRTLTTGRLGHGNRIMIPNKFLKSNDIRSLKKNVRSRIANIGKRKFLIIELENDSAGIPFFGDGYDESEERLK